VQKKKNKKKIKIEEQTKMKLPKEPKPPTAKQKTEPFETEENEISEPQANITETKQEEVVKSKNNNNDTIVMREETIKEIDKEPIPTTTQESLEKQDNQDEEKWIQQKEVERSKELEAIIEIKEKEEFMLRLKMGWEKEKLLEEQAAELIKNKHERILMESDRTTQSLNEIEMGLKIVDETDTLKRKEEISKEIQYIRKKWESMDNIELEKKEKLNMNVMQMTRCLKNSVKKKKI
jgi:hypothetical protein